MTEYTRIDRAIQIAKEKALLGEPLTKDEIIHLLEIPLGSDDDRRLRAAARETAAIRTGSTAYLWTAIGTDFEPCPMNCDFCSMGEKWGIVKAGKTYSETEILDRAKSFVSHGSDFIVLRTTQYYSKDKLKELAVKIRSTIPGTYDIILNTGELEIDEANTLAENCVDGIYHALRLGEGETTPFDPQLRYRTMKNVQASPLDLISLVEPIGPEHTNEEIAERFLGIVKAGAYISGAMARVPVEGTPFGDTEMLNDARIAQIIAVLRLSGGSTVKNICVHPASPEAVSSGANVVVVETGAIPRDSNLAVDSWNKFNVDQAKKLLTDAGYQLNCSKQK